MTNIQEMTTNNAKNKTYIIGHKAPDLDSISATILYAYLATELGKYSTIIPARAGNINRETAFVLDKLGMEAPQTLEDLAPEQADSFVLVDHNEETQRHELVATEQIVEIIDHHKVNLNTTKPVSILVRPWGSSASIIFDMGEQQGTIWPTNLKKLTLYAILSDTQGLKSVITTETDRSIAKKLAENLGVDIQEVTKELFGAKSDVTGLSHKEISTKDYKLFSFHGKTVFINQIETVDPQSILRMAEELKSALREIKTEMNAELAYNIVTDMLEGHSWAICETKEECEVLEKAFDTACQNGVADIGQRRSRKKEIAPFIEQTLK